MDMGFRQVGTAAKRGGSDAASYPVEKTTGTPRSISRSASGKTSTPPQIQVKHGSVDRPLSTGKCQCPFKVADGP